ncbi:26S proteasome regulatory subunit 7-like [Carex rostrata]
MKKSNVTALGICVDRNKYKIQIPLPPKIDPSVTMMTMEEKPDVTYNDIGGYKEQIEKKREVWSKRTGYLFGQYK